MHSARLANSAASTNKFQMYTTHSLYNIIHGCQVVIEFISPVSVISSHPKRKLLQNKCDISYQNEQPGHSMTLLVAILSWLAAQ